MKAVKCGLREAEETRKALIDEGVFSNEYKVKKKGNYLYLPVTREVDGLETVEITLEEIGKTKSFRESLQEVLNEEELSLVKTAFDNLGGIAIIEVDEALRKKETIIAQTLLSTTPNITTVVRKDGGHEGKLRLQKYQWLAGEKTYETTTTENKVKLTLDIRKTYYSSRSSTERLRIARLVEKGEEILVMFSGIAPFPLVIEKNSEPKKVVGVELNKEAHKHGKNNLQLNKTKKIMLHEGDVRTIVPKIGLFDRIIMPLPHNASDFLDTAIPALKEKGIIHLYDFCSEGEAGKKASELPKRINKLGVKAEVTHVERCGSLGPGMYRWCYDIQVNK